MGKSLLLLPESILDQRHQLRQRGIGLVAFDVEDHEVSLSGAEHHQAHDRGPADAVSVLLDLDLGVDLAGEVHELGARPRMESALVGDRDLPACLTLAAGQAAASPRISLATEIYL